VLVQLFTHCAVVNNMQFYYTLQSVLFGLVMVCWHDVGPNLVCSTDSCVSRAVLLTFSHNIEPVVDTSLLVWRTRHKYKFISYYFRVLSSVAE